MDWVIIPYLRISIYLLYKNISIEIIEKVLHIMIIKYIAAVNAKSLLRFNIYIDYFL